MKKILALVLALVMVLGLTAAFADDYHFEIVSKGFQSTYWQAVLKGANEEVEKINGEGADKITINFVGPDSESDVAQQVQQFTSALNANPAGIGFAAVDQNAFNDLLKEALEKKIPIIGFDSGVPGQDATGESVTQRGLGFIDKIIELAGEKGWKVAVIGNDFYVNGCKGEKAAEADAKIIIEALVPAQSTVELCANEASVLLNKEDLISVFGSNQVAAEGVVAADKNLFKCGTGDDTIIAVGFDSGATLKAAIREGVMYGAITQSPVGIGKVTIDLLLAAAKGEAVADTDTGCAFYTAENIDAPEIADNLYD